MTTLQDSILQAAEEKIESNLIPRVRVNYQKVVAAGMKVGLAKGPHGILGSLRNSKDPVSDCAIGAVNLVSLLRKQSRNTMPIEAMVPAGMTLMLQALDFVDKSNIQKIGVPELNRATHIFGNKIFQNLGITSQMLKNAHDNTLKATKDPVHLEAMKRKAGLVRAPDASTPTAAPDEGSLINGV